MGELTVNFKTVFKYFSKIKLQKIMDFCFISFFFFGPLNLFHIFISHKYLHQMLLCSTLSHHSLSLPLTSNSFTFPLKISKSSQIHAFISLKIIPLPPHKTFFLNLQLHFVHDVIIFTSQTQDAPSGCRFRHGRNPNGPRHRLPRNVPGRARRRRVQAR